MNKIMPMGVTVDKGQIDDFVDGVFGENQRRNKAAAKKAAILTVAAVAYTAHKKLSRRPY